MTITAHTGCMNTVPNTIESIIEGFKSGADIIEIDIRFTSGGIPILTHNKLTESEMSNAVTLEKAFECIADYPDKKVNLDIKETANIQLIQKLAEEKNVIKQIFFTGVEKKFIEAVRNGCPKIPYYLNYKIPSPLKFSTLYIKNLINNVKKYGAIGINLNKSLCSGKLVKMFHKQNLLVSVWTITDITTAKKYLNMNPDNITCKNPVEVISLVK